MLTRSDCPTCRARDEEHLVRVEDESIAKYELRIALERFLAQQFMDELVRRSRERLS